MIKPAKKYLTDIVASSILQPWLITQPTNQNTCKRKEVILLLINFDEERPIFLQIAEVLKDSIISGAYAEESQIPSITEFSVACKINPATALKGINILVDEGLLYKKRGLGMFVASGAKAQLIEKRKESFFHDYILPLVHETEKLGMSKEDLQKMIERGYLTDGN